jgi:hypothetical protein
MKPLVLLVALLAGRLTLASMAWAQDGAPGVPPGQPRVEVGVNAGAIWFEPTIGLLTSVRASKRSSIEGGATLTPAFVLTQAQARVRLPIGPPGGARRSLVVGLTHVSRRAGTSGTALEPGLGAHVGMSAQARVNRRLDVRADLHMLMPFGDGPDAVPRAMLGVAWHP